MRERIVLVALIFSACGVLDKKALPPDAPPGWEYVFHSPEGNTTSACTRDVDYVCGWTPKGTPGVEVWDFYLSGNELVRCGTEKNTQFPLINGYVMPLDPNGKGHPLFRDPNVNLGSTSTACAAGPGGGYYQLFGAKAILGDLATGTQTAVVADDPYATVGQLSVDDAGRAYWFKRESTANSNSTVRSYDPSTNALTTFDVTTDFGLPNDGTMLTMTAGESGKLYFVMASGDLVVVDVATKQATDLHTTGVTLVSHQMGQPIFAARASPNPDDVASNVGLLSTITADGTEKPLLDLQPLFGIGHGFGTNIEAIRVQGGKLYVGTGHGVYRTLMPVL